MAILNLLLIQRRCIASSSTRAIGPLSPTTFHLIIMTGSPGGLSLGVWQCLLGSQCVSWVHNVSPRGISETSSLRGWTNSYTHLLVYLHPYWLNYLPQFRLSHLKTLTTVTEHFVLEVRLNEHKWLFVWRLTWMCVCNWLCWTGFNPSNAHQDYTSSKKMI